MDLHKRNLNFSPNESDTTKTVCSFRACLKESVGKFTQYLNHVRVRFICWEKMINRYIVSIFQLNNRYKLDSESFGNIIVLMVNNSSRGKFKLSWYDSVILSFHTLGPQAGRGYWDISWKSMRRTEIKHIRIRNFETFAYYWELICKVVLKYLLTL